MSWTIKIKPIGYVSKEISIEHDGCQVSGIMNIDINVSAKAKIPTAVLTVLINNAEICLDDDNVTKILYDEQANKRYRVIEEVGEADGRNHA